MKTIVQCVTYTLASKGRDLLIGIKVQDDTGAVVPGAVVDISVSLDGALYGTGSGASMDASGLVPYKITRAPNDTYHTMVTSVVKAGLAFDKNTPPNEYVKTTMSTPASSCGGPSVLVAAQGAQAAEDFERVRKVKAAHSNDLMELPMWWVTPSFRTQTDSRSLRSTWTWKAALFLRSLCH